ncbi:MAG: hypothetical protein LBT05_06445 [Planctomycetaceae bacterium]|jgi:hypothetical protein|nr:hypothetical protein [Planctomycetaceae bacterium]
MDRIDISIQEAFAKFQDAPEIRAQKEEMADHLRDRIRDAIQQGKSEKEAFAEATAAVAESMTDLEQTLSQFLQPEFRNDKKRNQIPTKLNSKEIYINYYRYHRAIMLMFAEILLCLTVLFLCVLINDISGAYFDPELAVAPLLVITLCTECLLSVFVIYSVVAYMRNPNRVKSVLITWQDWLKRFLLGAVLLLIANMLFFYTLDSELFKREFFVPTSVYLFCLAFYTFFFILFSVWGWMRRGRYTTPPDTGQNQPLARWGILLTAISLGALFIPTLLETRHLLIINNKYANLVNHEIMDYQRLQKSEQNLSQQVKILSQQLETTQNQLIAVSGEHMRIPDAMILAQGESPDNLLIDQSIRHKINFRFNSSRLVSAKNENILFKRADTFPENSARSIIDANGIFVWSVPGINADYNIIPNRHIPPYNLLPILPFGSEPSLEKTEKYALSLKSDFPAHDLTDRMICARSFPFEEYKLGMIHAVAEENVEPNKRFYVKVGVGNLLSENAKLLLTVKYDSGLRQQYIPSDSMLFLTFLKAREYREYAIEMIATTPGEHKIQFQLRNGSGQILAETSATANVGNLKSETQVDDNPSL